MNSKFTTSCVRAIAAGVVLLASLPGLTTAASSGTVSATVTGAAPCITVSGSIAFGTLPFSQVNNLSGGFAGNQGTTVTNCGAQSEAILARLSTATNGNTNWTVTTGDPCANGSTNIYGMDVFDYSNYAGKLRMSGSDQTFLSSLGGNTGLTISGEIFMPCTGSAGAGVQMTSTITLTATF